jgi:hypothetical protein
MPWPGLCASSRAARCLRRSADDTDPIERVLVANADQLVVVSSLTDPPPRPRLIDRCLVAAYDAGLEPLLVLTKADLVPADDFIGQYAPAGRARASSPPADPIAPSSASKMCGPNSPGGCRCSSGIRGSASPPSSTRSSLEPTAASGRVNDVTGRGRHTSTSAIALRLPNDPGWVIDTPGVRSFGLAHVDVARIVSHFPDLEPGTETCPRGCTHDEPECGLDEFVANGGGGAPAARLASTRSADCSAPAPAMSTPTPEDACATARRRAPRDRELSRAQRGLRPPEHTNGALAVGALPVIVGFIGLLAIGVTVTQETYESVQSGRGAAAFDEPVQTWMVAHRIALAGHGGDLVHPPGRQGRDDDPRHRSRSWRWPDRWRTWSPVRHHAVGDGRVADVDDPRQGR